MGIFNFLNFNSQQGELIEKKTTDGAHGEGFEVISIFV